MKYIIIPISRLLFIVLVYPIFRIMFLIIAILETIWTFKLDGLNELFKKDKFFWSQPYTKYVYVSFSDYILNRKTYL